MFRIPIPKTGGEVLNEGIQNLMERLQKKPLMEAQTEQARAKAAQSNMLASLLSQAMGGQGISSGSQGGSFGTQGSSQSSLPMGIDQSQGMTGQQNQGMSASKPGMSMNQAILAMGALGMGQPTIVNGQMITPFGTFKVGESKQEEREAQTGQEFIRGLQSNDRKNMEKWNDTITSSHQMQPVLEDMQEISANPSFQSMYKNPEYLGYDINYLKRFGTPEQQELLGRFTTNQKSIFSSMGQDFKGAFREFELKIFNGATPLETDTLPQIISKTNTLLSLRKLVSDRLTLAQDIVKSTGGKISSSAALDIADKQINAKKIRKQIQDQFELSNKQQKLDKEKREKSFGGNSKSKETTTIIDPNGNEHIIYKHQLKSALEKYPGTREKTEGIS